MGHVFISHSHKDAAFVGELKQHLKNADFDVWTLQEQSPQGVDWRKAVDEAIMQASTLIAVVSQDANQSQNIRYEWTSASGAGVPIVPILLQSTKLPYQLIDRHYIDFRRQHSWETLITYLKQVQQQSDLFLHDDTSTLVIHGDDVADSPNSGETEFEVESLVQINPALTREMITQVVSQYPGNISLNIPYDLYNRIRQSAEINNRPFETEMLESLNVLFKTATTPTHLDAELDKLPSYSTGQLWAVVYRRLASHQTKRLHTLVAQSKQDELSKYEQDELNTLLELNNIQMVLRSEALLLLQQRGSDVHTYMQMGA